MLGPLSPLLDFIFENPRIVNSILVAIVLIYIAGRVQLKIIQQKSESLVVELGREITRKKPHITKSGLFKKIYPQWSDAIRGWAIFVPSKYDFYPVLVKPEIVKQKMDFSPDWMASVLNRHQIYLDEDRQIDNPAMKS